MTADTFVCDSRRTWVAQLRLVEYMLADFAEDGSLINWERFIQRSADLELTRIQNKLRRCTENNYVPEDIAAEENGKAESLRRELYATLVVAMWSRIEDLLTRIAFSRDRAQKSIRRPSSLCLKWATVFHQVDRVPQGKWNSTRQGNFWQLVKQIKKSSNVNLTDCSNFNFINAIRILNNCYKHQNGTYTHSRKKREQIDVSLLQSWAIVPNDGFIKYRNPRIEYGRLSICELAAGSKSFADDLLGRIRRNCLSAN